MGFMDKAKKMAEQAQAKLDEAQKQFNSGHGAGAQGGGDAAEYDKHGRPVSPAPVTPDTAAAPPVAAPIAAPDTAEAPPAATPGVPPTDTPAAPAQTGPTPDPGAPETPGVPPASPAATTPPASTGPTPDPGAPEDRNRPSTEAPKVTHGDPLAG